MSLQRAPPIVTSAHTIDKESAMTTPSHIRKAALIAAVGCAALATWSSAGTAAADQRDHGTPKAPR